MVSHDDKYRMLALIQNAYITSDETGICEEIFAEEYSDYDEDPAALPVFQSEFYPEEPKRPSPPLTLGKCRAPLSTYSERSIGKRKLQRQKTAKTQRITWKYDATQKIDEIELSEMFRRKNSFCRSSSTSEGEPPPTAPFRNSPTTSLSPSLVRSVSEESDTDVSVSEVKNKHLFGSETKVSGTSSPSETGCSPPDADTFVPETGDSISETGSFVSPEAIVDDVSLAQFTDISGTEPIFTDISGTEPIFTDISGTEPVFTYISGTDPAVTDISATELSPSIRFSTNHKSLLSHLLAHSESTTKNPFIEYAKFDGFGHNNVPSKKIDVYPHVVPNQCLDYPLKMCVVNTAKVSDFIGLICYYYTKDSRQPPLKTVDYYQLHIGEEDGDYESDFMPLEKTALIDKYHFKILALVQKEAPDVAKGILVTVSFAGGGFSSFEVPNSDVLLREILDKSVSRRKEIGRIKEAGVDYHLEKEEEPGLALDLDKTLGYIQCTKFAAVRDNSKRVIDLDAYSSIFSEVDIPHTFNVVWVHKFSKYETRIEIYEQLEIVPLQSKSPTSILSPRFPSPQTYQLNQVVDCSSKPVKKSKLEVILTVRGDHRFKSFKFHCLSDVGQELLKQVKLIIKYYNKVMSRKSNSGPPKFYARRHESFIFNRRKSKSEGVS